MSEQVLVQLAEVEGSTLEGPLAAPALATVLRELPLHLPVNNATEEELGFQAAILHCVRCLLRYRFRPLLSRRPRSDSGMCPWPCSQWGRGGLP